MGLFSDGDATAEIITLEEGTILGSNDEIPIELLLKNETPSSFLITLLDSEETVRGIVTLEEEELSLDIPPLGLPEELEDGYYELNLELFSGEETLTSSVLPFFLLNDQPRIQGMVSYPLVFYPGGKGLVFLESYLPSELEPWIRWSFEGEVISEGPFFDGLDRVEVTVPETIGIYTLSVEIIPMLPPEGEEWPFTSPLVDETRIYVSDDIQTGGNIPLDEGRFYSLFHFQGEFNDWGERVEPLKLYSGNEPDIDVKKGVFGYRMAEFDNFIADSFLFPKNEEGFLEPFSLYMTFWLDDTPDERQILNSVLPGFDFNISTDSFGILTTTLTGDDGTLVLTSEEPLAGGAYDQLIISVYPDYENGILTLSLYYGDHFSMIHTDLWLPGVLGEEGHTEFGGDSGGLDILDELAVFYKDSYGRASVTPDLFSRWNNELYSSRLIYADGFDSLDLREELVELSSFNHGEPSHSFGRIGLDPASLFNFSGIPVEDGKYTLNINLQDYLEDTEEPAVWLEFREETGEGAVLLGELPLASDKVELNLTLSREEGLLLVDETFYPLNELSGEVLIPATDTDFVEPEMVQKRIIIGLSNRQETFLFLEDILILSEPLFKESTLRLEYTPDL
ncbi:MAG: hypothetical protein JEY99_06245 [Spirochaetales bacterium]|nr:hypothetical protein [Spirochaetales bacterium]